MTEPQGTPLTDEVEVDLNECISIEPDRRSYARKYVRASFARDLERKLAGLREELAEAKEDCGTAWLSQHEWQEKAQTAERQLAEAQTELAITQSELEQSGALFDKSIDGAKAELAALREQLAERDKALKIAELKNRGTLANNLCCDHRDKQTGQPCLACTIETLTRRLASRPGYAWVPVEPSEEMSDAVRGILQVLRGKSGASFRDLRSHCEARGDDMKLWPAWAMTEQGYVTEGAAASLIYSIMVLEASKEGGE